MGGHSSGRVVQGKGESKEVSGGPPEPESGVRVMTVTLGTYRNFLGYTSDTPTRSDPPHPDGTSTHSQGEHVSSVRVRTSWREHSLVCGQVRVLFTLLTLVLTLRVPERVRFTSHLCPDLVSLFLLSVCTYPVSLGDEGSCMTHTL